MPSMNIAQLLAGQCISWVALKMQHTTRLLSGIGRDVSGSRPQPCMRWLGTPPAHDRPIQAQLQAPAPGPLFDEEGGPPGKTSFQGCRQWSGECKPLFRVTRCFRNLVEAGLRCGGSVVKLACALQYI